MMNSSWATMKQMLIRACQNSRALKLSSDSNLVEINGDSSWYIEMSEILCKLTSKIEEDKGRGNTLTERWFKDWKKQFNETLEILPEVSSTPDGGLGKRRKRNASGNSNRSNSKKIRMDGSRSRNPSGASSTGGLYIKNESHSDDGEGVLNRPPRPKRASRAKRPVLENEDDSKGSEIEKS